jgi:hypothetical protein
MIAVGKGTSQPYPRIGKLEIDKIVSVDRF